MHAYYACMHGCCELLSDIAGDRSASDRRGREMAPKRQPPVTRAPESTENSGSDAADFSVPEDGGSMRGGRRKPVAIRGRSRRVRAERSPSVTSDLAYYSMRKGERE